MMLLLLVLVVGVGLYVASTASRNRRHQELEERRVADLEAVRRVADEDVTRFGEELQRLDGDLLVETLDEAARQDYQRALDSYESAKDSMTRLTQPEDVRHVSEALEDGRYAVTCVRARVAGEPLPTRRPPCFFNPAHGPSSTDIEWAPPGGRPRQVPVCAADADRVSQGADPDVRTVPSGVGRVPYWQGGPAYAPWAGGYFGGYVASGLVPAILIGSLMAPTWDGGFDGDIAGDGGFDGGFDGGGGWGDGGGFDGGFDGGLRRGILTARGAPGATVGRPRRPSRSSTGRR